MVVTVRSEFVLALNQVCAERGLDVNVVLETIKNAIAAAYRKDFGGKTEDYFVEINKENGEAKIFQQLENGKKGKEITPPGFGRIAAQTAKQVILQRIREEEKKAIISDYAKKVGAVVNGMVLRFEGPTVIVNIGKGQGVMPPQEQSRQEKYHLNQRLMVYIVGIKEEPKRSEIIVSRSHPGLVEGLFHREVPELQSGAVKIKDVAREAGNRSKVAVFSSQSGVDPVGSCVGQRGVRVQAVIDELGRQEKIDIIPWDEDAVKFITAALSPAKNIKLIVDEEKKTALALIDDDQLSLAIGRDGQNVRLAVKLSGYKIDIRSKTTLKKSPKIKNDLHYKIDKLKLSPRIKKVLIEAKLTKLSDLMKKTDEEILQIKGIGQKGLKEIKKSLSSH